MKGNEQNETFPIKRSLYASLMYRIEDSSRFSLFCRKIDIIGIQAFVDQTLVNLNSYCVKNLTIHNHANSLFSKYSISMLLEI